VTYIDDGILIDDRGRIKESLATYIGLVRDVFGPDGVNMEKVSLWESKLVAIGWEFDFETWRVQPKTRGLAKLLHFLFVVIPLGHTTVHEKDLERLCGLLNWYAPGIPAGNAFVASLYRCKARVGAMSHRVRLSTPALKDIMWWRALAVMAWKCPHVLGADIEAVRRSPTATVFLRTDASSLIGGGGFLSNVEGGEPPSSAPLLFRARSKKRHLSSFRERDLPAPSRESAHLVHCLLDYLRFEEGSQPIGTRCRQVADVLFQVRLWSRGDINVLEGASWARAVAVDVSAQIQHAEVMH
jgi:hypothetical protein